VSEFRFGNEHSRTQNAADAPAPWSTRLWRIGLDEAITQLEACGLVRGRMERSLFELEKDAKTTTPVPDPAGPKLSTPRGLMCCPSSVPSAPRGAAGEARGVVGEHVSLSCGEVAHNRPAGTRNPAIAWAAGLAMGRPAQGFPPGIGTGRNWPLALSKPATANGDICTSRTQ
jgi:hypothetical protein